MKPKMQCEVEPRVIVPAAQVEQEIQNFLEAVDSYPDRVAKEPGITFQQHLASISALHAPAARTRVH